MDKSIVRRYRRGRIHLRIRKKVLGTPERPRMAVYRSNKHFYAQAIDDLSGATLVSASTLEQGFADAMKKGPAVQVATQLGTYMAEKAKSKGITQVVFDRGGFLYHGRVKAFADGARKAGLSF